MEKILQISEISQRYAKYRPGYPPEYFQYLEEVCQLRKGAPVADAGSGTGVFTRGLLDWGLEVYAIEPESTVRRYAEETCGKYPLFHSVAATAEHTTLEARSVQLVAAAQSFHWFDQEQFKRECLRILHPQPWVALAWDTRKRCPLIYENYAICREYCPRFQGFSGDMKQDPESILPFFIRRTVETRRFEHSMPMTLEDFLGRNCSASYAPQKEEAAYRPYVEALTVLFERFSSGGTLLFPHETRSFLGMISLD